MFLAIDVGNTNTVFALFEGEEVKYFWRCQTEVSRSVDEYAVFLNQLFSLESLTWDDVSSVLISSVVPDANFHLSRFCQKYLNLEADFIDIDTATGIKIDLDQPREIGADRLVDAVAVKAHYDLPSIVIDFGTATTFDVIDKGGVYKGGVIAPGVRLSMEALAMRAAKLPNIDIAKPDKAIGTSTQSAMQSGVYWGYVGLIEKIVERLSFELGVKPYVIATGGLAPLYAESTDVIDCVDEKLILKGLYEIYKNKKKA